MFAVETKGLQLKDWSDTAKKRAVFDIRSEYATEKNCANLIPAMRGRVVNFEIVDEDQWQPRLTAMPRADSP